MQKWLLIIPLLIILGQTTKSQQTSISLQLIKEEASALPGGIINAPYFIRNNSNSVKSIQTVISAPQGWNVLLKADSATIQAQNQTFGIFTVQIPAGYPVGNYPVLFEIQNKNKKPLASGQVNITVKEIEKIDLQLIKVPDYVLGGDSLITWYLLKNLGNVEKRVYLETGNCTILGNSERRLKPGESKRFAAFKITSTELAEASNEYITVRAKINAKTLASVYTSVIAFPSKNIKKDLFHRLPVSLSATYISTNQNDRFQSAYQFELYGNGSLDPAQKHNLEFLARGPNNSNLGFLGLYSQYYLSYANKNMEVFLGEKAFEFTPLTESSRFGTGAEGKFKLNNGLFMGALYVKPRFFDEIKDEYAVFTGFEKDQNNSVSAYFIQKNNELSWEPVYLGSLNSAFQPFEKTNVDLEFSRGTYMGSSDNAFRTNLNTQFSVFNLAGSYYHTGKNYPGYFSNSTFYSGHFSANITPKINLGIYAREDFINAALDTFFLYAPYSKSYQTIINYNFANRSYFKFYWRNYERKDRLALDKFHYRTRSVNAQVNQKIKNFDYDLLGEIGNTTNYLLAPGANEQRTYRTSLNLGYRFNRWNAIRLFGSWSNINSFVSGEQRNFTAGMSMVTRINKNISANFHLQNAYNIEDYYRNRNLMQLNVDYRFLSQHKITLRSFYTLFRLETEKPEFTFAITYSYKFGIPVKQLMKAGDLSGQITDDNGEPMEGVILSMLNKSTVTDDNGEFLFKSIQPGKHLLIVDRTNFKINQTLNIPTPIEVEILEDRETTLHFKITNGARVTGTFISGSDPGLKVPPQNIIIELSNENEQFRISTQPDGSFSFPVVRSGNWNFKIYTNTLPSGFEVKQSEFNLQLVPGENFKFDIELKKKKRNIIFKSQGISLSTTPVQKTVITNTSTPPETGKNEKAIESFYTVQIGVFSKKINPESRFFKGREYSHEIKSGKYYMYFIGTFENEEQAQKAKAGLQELFKGAFVVKIENGKILRQ